MALFKISKGNSTNLPALSNSDDGFSWFTYDDGKFYIDYKDPADNILKRKALNAASADNASQAGYATKAAQDESGNNIKATYAASFSISDHTITLKNKNGVSLGTVTVPDNDTKNTAGSTDTSNKIFLIGATSQAANPQTYSDNDVFVTDGTLSTKNLAVSGIVNLNGETSADSLTVGNLQINGSANFVNAPTVSSLIASQSVVTDANKKLVSKDLTVSSATAETTTATTFVYSVTSDATGKITVKTRPLPTYNNYSLPLAASGTRGGIQIGYSESGNNYAVKLSSEKAYVTVPWTDTKVTSVGNHYAPAADANAALSASASGASAAWSIDVVKAVQLQRDAKGHVTGITVTSGKIPGNPNTDYKVRQTNDTSDTNYRVLLSYAANNDQVDNITHKSGNLIYNPSANQLSTGNLVLTGTLDVTGNTNLHSATSIDSLTAGSLIVNGNSSFVNDVSFTKIPTAPTAAAGTNNTQLATTAFVMNAFTANDAMVFKGVVNSASGLPATHSQGWTYKVGTAGSYVGTYCEVGDLIICVTDGTSANNAHWAVVQNNVDGAVFMGHGGAAIGGTTQPVYVKANGEVAAGTALKALAYKDSISYTPAGTISSTSITPAGTISSTSITPAGTNAKSAVTIKATTTDVYSMTSAGSVTAGTAASLSMSVVDEVLSFSWTTNTPTAVTLPGRSSVIKAWTGYTTGVDNTYAAAQVFTGTAASHNHTFSGTAASHNHTFTGTAATLS